jgi:uncharacterized protein (DUF608 family)
MQAAAGNVKDFGEEVWGKVGKAVDVFRSVDLDGDGVPDEARAMTLAKDVGTGISGVAGTVGGAASSLFKRAKPSRRQPGEGQGTDSDG